MQPGQFLVNKDGEKRKILGVCGEVIFVSMKDEFDVYWSGITKEVLKIQGWSLLEEPWVPLIGEKYWKVDSDGGIYQKENFGSSSDEFHIKTGNYARTEADAELYKQKLIERMGNNS